MNQRAPQQQQQALMDCASRQAATARARPHRRRRVASPTKRAASPPRCSRPWLSALQLRAALEEERGQLPGFMRMCDCLVRTDDPGGGKARFSGMIMEKLNGKPLSVGGCSPLPVAALLAVVAPMPRAGPANVAAHHAACAGTRGLAALLRLRLGRPLWLSGVAARCMCQHPHFCLELDCACRVPALETANGWLAGVALLAAAAPPLAATLAQCRCRRFPTCRLGGVQTNRHARGEGASLAGSRQGPQDAQSRCMLCSLLHRALKERRLSS